MTLPNPCVLVIDDDPGVRKLLRAILRSNAFRWTEAGTGQEALAKARARQPEVILVDLALPDMRGVGIIGELRKYSRAPIVVLSSPAHEHEKVQALDAGAADYVAKPFGGAELVARIRAVLRRAAFP